MCRNITTTDNFLYIYLQNKFPQLLLLVTFLNIEVSVLAVIYILHICDVIQQISRNIQIF